jgi:hypothetical protein
MAPLLAACLLSAGLAPASQSTTLFGLVDTGELYASTNNGAAWSIIATLPVNDAVGLAAGSSTSDLYIVTCSGSVYRSANGGIAWNAVGTVTASDVAAFTLLPSGTLVVLTGTGTLYVSSDLGATFAAQTTLTGSDWVSLLRGPIGGLYALTRTGQIAESTDDGATWTTKGAISVPNAVSIRRLGAALYVLAETGEVYRSLDYGSTWTAVAALTSSRMGALAEAAGVLVAATREGEVARSSNGANWSWVGAINQLSVVALGTDTPLATGVEPEVAAPRFVVRGPYPNPGRGGSASFGITLPGPDRLRMELYDVAGRLCAAREEEMFPTAGSYERRWVPAGLPAGTYMVRFVGRSGREATAKWTLVR